MRLINWLKGLFRRGIRIIKDNWHLYLWCNAIYYGIVLGGIVVTIFAPQIQQQLLSTISEGSAAEGSLLNTVSRAYLSESIWNAAVITFFINLLAGTFLVLTLPSVIFPPLAGVVAAYRAALWGLLLSPVSPELRQPMVLHSLTLLLEGQGYILAVFAGLAAFKGWLKPETFGKNKRLSGYWQGWREAFPVYFLVILVLAVAAVYEAVTVIIMIKAGSW